MLTILIALGIFLTVVLLFEGGYYLIHARSRSTENQQRITERLQSWTERQDLNKPSELVLKETQSGIPWLNSFVNWLKERKILTKVIDTHDKAKPPYSLGHYVMAAVILALLGGTLGSQSVMGQPYVTLGAATLAMLLPWGHLYYRKRVRLAEIHRQLPDALELIVRALRAGHALFVGMKMVGSEMRDPIGGEFQRGFDEISMGASVPESMGHMADRIDLMDMKFFVTSVNIQRETGGNLAEIIDMLGRLIRKRFELKKKVRALSAEGRISAIILMSLPFAMVAILHTVNPEYMSLLYTDPLGQMMVVTAFVLMVLGGIVMKRMIAIKV